VGNLHKTLDRLRRPGAVKLYKEAMESGQPYDAVIVDLTVPGGMGGKEIIQKLKEIDPEVRAIVSSGYSNDPIMADFGKYGFQGVITKPYKPRDLSEILHEVVIGSSD
jgi:two-component system cell cycle sensor histidine kinase/response regulator CckA